MTNNNSGWPHHMAADGSWKRCASNPCKLHSDLDTSKIQTEDDLRNYLDKDGMLTNYNVSDPSERTRLDKLISDNMMTSSERYIGMSNRPDAEMKVNYKAWKNIANRVINASYGAAEKSTPRKPVDVRGFMSSHVGSDGMFTGIDKNAISDMGRMSTEPLSEDSQSALVANFTNKKYMNAALKRIDYDKLPAATESINYLSANPSTSSNNIHEAVSAAISNRKNPNFAKQVYVSDIANHPNLSKADAKRLYAAWPEDTVRARHCPADIVNDAITNPSTPENIRAIALTNPQADAKAVREALKSGDNVTKAQAMLNPSGVYLDTVNAGSLFSDDEHEKPFTEEEQAAARKAQQRIAGIAGMSI